MQLQRDEFNNQLETTGISKREFCEKIGLNYDTINGWGSNNKTIPVWVESWLHNFKKAQLYEELKKKVFEIEGIKS